MFGIIIQRWGLPAYLGYKKAGIIVATLNTSKSVYSGLLLPVTPFGFDYETEDGSGNEWLDASGGTNQIVNLDDL